MIKNGQYSMAALSILSSRGEMNKWELMEAVGKQLNVPIPVFNIPFRVRHMVELRRLERNGDVTPMRRMEKVAGVDVGVRYYKLPASNLEH